MIRWRQGAHIPHHVYWQRGDWPDASPPPDGDPAVAMFLDPDDAALACAAVNAIAYDIKQASRIAGRPDHLDVPQARVSPDGYLAQRFAQNFNKAGNWVVTSMGEYGIELKIVDDEAVAEWPRLVSPPVGGEL